MPRAWRNEKIRRFPVLATALLVITLGYSHTARAQIGGTTDILTGAVTGPGGKPLANATVTARSVETGIERTKRTGSDGRYTILFPGGGGRYRMEFRAIGLEPVVRAVLRQGDEDRLVTDVTLGTAIPTVLSTVSVTGTAGEGAKKSSPGEGGRDLSARELAELPVDQSDVSAIAALAPGVVTESGTDSTDATFSIAGQRSTLNNTTLDGLTFGSFSVPPEGLRSTKVITNTYDPARGQFSGGEIASTTRAGTNDVTGGLTYSRQDPTLQVDGSDTNTVVQQLLEDRVSAGFGGPIVKNKFFIFASGQYRRRSDAFQSLLTTAPATFGTLGLESGDVAAFENALNGYGIPSATSIPGRRIRDNASALVRLDYFLSDAHTLTVRGDYSSRSWDPTHSSPLALATTSGERKRSEAGIATTLTSYFGNGVINELRAYYSHDDNRSTPYALFPSGRVRLTSTLDDGTQGISVLQFGGNRSYPRDETNTLLEASNEVSYLTSDGAHRIKLGLLFDLSTFNEDETSNQLGTFTYNSLAAFQNNVPDSYTRTRGLQKRKGNTQSGAIYLGDTWSPKHGLQFVYGLRAEASRVGAAPPLNPDVEQLFGFRTNDFPSEFHVSPRAGFSLNLSEEADERVDESRPAFLIQGGIGEFRARMPSDLYTSALSATGLADTEQQLLCIGSAVPIPDWTTYTSDPYAAPMSCVGGPGLPSSFVSDLPSVTVFDPNFKAPRSWRASLGVQHGVFGDFKLSADVSYARGVSLYGARDLNLNTTPAFTLDDEGGRPVYATPNAIVPTTGEVNAGASRRFAQYGQVLEFISGLQSDTRQLTLALDGETHGGTYLRLSYTLQDTRDQSSFTCCSAARAFSSPSTAGNPNVAEWAPGDWDTRHSIRAVISQPVTSWMNVTAIGRLSSGRPFTPEVDGDINGDGASNDRAFIFDPNNTSDPATAAAMQSLLASAPARVRDCLNAQLGTVAGRNSCRGPWTPSLDLQANIRPSGFNLDRHVTFSLIGSNVLAGLDQLLHGGNLRGWGQYNRADPTLLYVRGFDPVTHRFVYDVNSRFGSNNVWHRVYRQPFVLTLKAQFTLGSDERGR